MQSRLRSRDLFRDYLRLTYKTVTRGRIRPQFELATAAHATKSSARELREVRGFGPEALAAFARDLATLMLSPNASQHKRPNRSSVTSMSRQLLWALAASLVNTGCWGLPVDQSPQCAAYVGCIEAIDRAADQITNLDRYVVDGACWDNPELGRGCTTSCARALERLQTREPSLPMECQP